MLFEGCGFMAKKVPWDKFEAAILLEGWLRVKEGIPRSEVITLVSYKLRQKAVNQGVAIDSIFRNTNGIHFQLPSMESAFEGTDVGLNPSKLFMEVADLYHSDFPSYSKLIEEAMQMLEGTSEVKDNFTQFLYTQVPDKADKILVAIKNIDEFAIATKALPCSFFDVLSEDTISLLRKKVLNHKFFMVRYKKLLEYATLALSLLEKFILSTGDTSRPNNGDIEKHTNDEGRKVNKENRQTDNISFSEWITQCTGLSQATARAYRSALNTCDQYAFERQLYSESITLCTTFNDFLIKYTALMTDEGFIKLSKMKHNYLVVALKKYHDYFFALDTDSASSITRQNVVRPTDQPSVSDEVKNNCNTILIQDFEDGYLIGDYMHQMRFLSCYEDTFGGELGVTEDELDKLLKDVGQIRDGRIFCKGNNDTTLIASILEVVENAFVNGATAVFFECIYERYMDSLISEMNIYNADALRDIMKIDSRFQANYHIGRSAVAKNGISADTANEIKTILKSSHTPLTYEDFKERLWYVPLDRIKSELSRLPEAVCVERGTYLYALNFNISPDERVALIKAMRSAIYSNGYLVAKNLREIFNKACPSAALDSEYLKDYAIRDILKIILRDEFDFSSSVITEKGNPLDIGQLYRDYAAKHEKLTLREIKEFQEANGLPIYWGDIFKEMVRISATELVRKDKVQFDVEGVDDALEKMYPNEYTALKDITLFLSLLAASVRWNGYVLESYLRDYSKKFRLVQISISNDDYYGVMLRSTSNLESYNDVAADMLAKNKGWTDEKSALKCLVDAKFQQRAKNSNISAIVKAARQKRANI